MIQPATNRLYWSRELQRIKDPADGFEYTSSSYFRIQGKQAFGLPTLKLNRVQRRTLKFLRNFQEQHGYIRVVIGKARQLGMSTLFAALVDHSLYFRRDRNALLVTHDEDTSKEMLGKHKIIYEGLPDPLKPERGTNSLTAMSFPRRNTQVLANHARNLNVGASLMQHIVHLSEVARYPDASTVQSSLFPSISDAKGEEFGDCSMIIMESTSWRTGEWFKAFAEDARDGKNGFGFLFVPWFVHEAYYRTPPKGWTPTLEEKERFDRYADQGMSYGNLAWYREAKAAYELSQLKGTDVDNGALFSQEYPDSWEDSWVLPQGSSRVFKDAAIKSVYREQRGRPYEPTNKGLVPHMDSPLEVFALPEDGVVYDIGIDPAGRPTKTSDFTAIEVVRRDSLEQVAEARHKWDCASPEFLEFVWWLAKCYNTAQLNIDITGGWGQALLSYLQRKHYPYIWQRRVRDDAKERISLRMGFVYTVRDKSNLISNAVVLMSANDLTVHSELLKGELVTFLQFAFDEWGAAPGAKDDLANAWMLALLSASDDRSERQAPLELAPKNPAPQVEKCFFHDPIAALERDALKKSRFTQPRCIVHTTS